ncbi:MAG: tetratricopeptide repeat protein [Syntrophales bacterium]|nr:tetratricopeptide repeat protein [Syntrophales bacterium]
MRKKNYWIIGIIIPLLALFSGCSTFIKADTLLARKDYRGAIELYKEHLVQHPGDSNAKSNLGFAYFKAGMLDNAAEEFQSSLKITPGDPFSTLYLGATYLKQKKLTQAITVWEKYKDSERSQVEKEIERQLALLRTASSVTESGKFTAQEIAEQMEQSIAKAEAAWYDAEFRALTEDQDSEGGGGG